MSTDRSTLGREAMRDREAPGELLRRYLAAAGWQAVGYALLGLGFLALVIGWFGVSNESVVAKQIPYLVSGGLGGAFMLGVGTLLLVTHELRLDNRRLESVEMLMEELRDALLLDHERTTSTREFARGADDAALLGDRIAGANGGRPGEFVVVAGGSKYHLPSCSSAAGKDVTTVGAKELKRQGLEPCRLCTPDVHVTA